MSKIFLTLVLMVSGQLAIANANSNANAEKAVTCKVTIRENKVTTTKTFPFTCDNYGEDATIKSPKGRYTIIAFSEESCVPVLIIHDNKLKAAATSFVDTKRNADEEYGKPFSVFTDKVVGVVYAPAVKLEDILNSKNDNDQVTLKCSTDTSLLND